MRSSHFFTVLAVSLVLFMVPVASAQVCGDADGHGTINITDYVAVLSYLGNVAPVPAQPAMADIDDRGGITVSDLGRYLCYIFGPFEPPPDCTPSLTYTLTNSDVDTIFMPYITGIPDGIDSVSLPVISSMAPGAYSYYLPMLHAGPGDNGLFHLTSVKRGPTATTFCNGFKVGDTAILAACFDRNDPSPSGRFTGFTLTYVRNAPGLASIAPAPVNRSTLWIPTIERNFDLFQPIIANLAYTIPPETLKTTPTSLAFSTMAGKVTADSFLVSFASSSIPFSFTLTTSDPWISLRNLPVGPLTTPMSIWVKADATALPVGTYNGQINMIPVIPGKPTDPASVSVSFNVTVPVVYPPGDFNCDGISNLADLAILVSYLTGGTTYLYDCNR